MVSSRRGFVDFFSRLLEPDDQNMNMTEAREFVGGIGYPRGLIGLPLGMNVSWPLAKLKASRSRLVLRPVWFVRFFAPTFVAARQEVMKIERVPRGLKINCQGMENDPIYFWKSRPTETLRLLEDFGYAVDPELHSSEFLVGRWHD